MSKETARGLSLVTLKEERPGDEALATPSSGRGTS